MAEYEYHDPSIRKEREFKERLLSMTRTIIMLLIFDPDDLEKYEAEDIEDESLTEFPEIQAMENELGEINDLDELLEFADAKGVPLDDEDVAMIKEESERMNLLEMPEASENN